MQVGGDGVDLFGLIVLALIVNLTAAMWAAGVAMRLRTIQAGPVMQMPVFIILFLAPVYVPLDLLERVGPRRSRTVNPFTALIEGGRDLISGQSFDAVLVYGVALVLLASSRLGRDRPGACAACAGPRPPARDERLPWGGCSARLSSARDPRSRCEHKVLVFYSRRSKLRSPSRVFTLPCGASPAPAPLERDPGQRAGRARPGSAQARSPSSVITAGATIIRTIRTSIRIALAEARGRSS